MSGYFDGTAPVDHVSTSWSGAHPEQTLTEFLLARIAEDEAAATFHRDDAWNIQDTRRHWMDDPRPELVGGGKLLAEFDGEHGVLAADHVQRWNPGRVKAECEAKRRIVALHGFASWDTPGGERRACTSCGYYEDEPVVDWPCPTIRALALPYADHPDYREEWRP